jgi:O-antigen ligase
MMDRVTVDADRGAAPRSTAVGQTRIGALAFSVVARLIAGVLLLGLLAYPVRAVLLDPDTAWRVKAGWAAALALGAVHPFWGACLMVILVPLLPVTPFVVWGVPHGVVHLVVLSQAVPLLYRVVRGRQRWPNDEVFAALAAFVTVALASLVVCYAGLYPPFSSLWQFAGEVHRQVSGYVFERPGPGLENQVGAFSTLIDGLLAYCVIRAALRERGATATAMIRAAVGVSLVVALLGVLQPFGGVALQPMWQVFDPGIIRINSTYSDPNSLASYFALMIPIAAAAAARAGGLGRRAAGLAAVLLLLCALVMTAGRMAYVATAIGVFLLGLAGIRRGLDRQDPSRLVQRYFRRAVYGSVALLLVAVVVVASVGTALDVRHRDQTSYLRTALYTLNLRQPPDAILKNRVLIWRTVMRMVAEAPVFGTGVGRVFREFGAYNAPIGGFEPGTHLTAHQTFLQIAAELGIVGLLAWVATLGLVYAAAFRRPASPEDRFTTWTRLGLACGLTAYGLTMLTGDRTILREDVVMFFAMAGLATSLAPVLPGLARWSRRVAFGFVLALLLTVPFRADARADRVKLEYVAQGFSGPEIDPDGVEFRWTTDHAVFHVPADARAVTLNLRSLAPFPQRVQVHLDGAMADELALREHDWHLVRYVLPRRDPSVRYYRFDLRVTPTWSPPDDPRTLGVMVAGLSWAR